MLRKSFLFRACDKCLELGLRTRLMGVVNVTPDSFSDGGRYFSAQEAIDRCLQIVDEGADLIDIGGESTRPGSNPVSAHEELERILPVIEAVRPLVPVMISVDTYKSRVAEEALKAGADVINDISSFRFDPGIAEVVAQSSAGVILMHCRGTPSTMHQLPPSADIIRDVCEGLQIAVNTAYKSGIDRDRIVVDPGIGFGKNAVENLQILNRLRFLEEMGLPLLVGPSRKRFIESVLGLPVDQRIVGTVAAAVVAVLNGAHMLRVHDVAEVHQATQVTDAILSEALPE
jgi:dihydropteroate synthase